MAGGMMKRIERRFLPAQAQDPRGPRWPRRMVPVFKIVRATRAAVLRVREMSWRAAA